MDFKEIKAELGDHFGHFADFINDHVQKLNLSEDAKILDVGTGYGTMAIILAYNGFDVITGEPKGDNWSDWRIHAQTVQLEEKINFQPFNSEELPFENDSFDAIFLNGTLHHIPDKHQAILECTGCLKSYGLLVIFEFTPAGIEKLRLEKPDHPDAVDPRDFIEDLELKCSIDETELIIAYIFQKVV